jgi:hypothetical protein
LWVTLAPASLSTGANLPSADECGASFVDRSFDTFLEDRLGPDDWQKLNESNSEDYGTGGHFVVKHLVRLMHDRFEPIKHGFDGKDDELIQAIPLPRGIGDTDNLEKGIVDGAIKITT